MTVKVPFHLERREQAEPATALLLLSHEVPQLLQLLGRLGFDPLPPAYAVTDGFLIQLPQPAAEPPVGSLKLRKLADGLLLPADADLVPALLQEEASGLVRRHGLIFLPGGRVLQFNPDEPLRLNSLLSAHQVRRRAWKPLPDAPALPERLVEIALEQSPERADEILEEGGEGIATEDPRPAASGMLANMLGNMSVQLGKGLAHLGQALHLSALARLGADWMARGMNLAPRLSEALLEKHEAALRYLLQKFRDGDIDWALRHAVPLTEERLRGARPASGELPTHNILYFLRNILAGSSPAGMWFSRTDAYHDLQREYHKLAEQATREGDFRRAAFIYGKLLRDFRAAAAVLSRGGLHQDAAALYLAKVGDTLAAAREYEAAGAFDDALHLYRRRGDHELAAQLLRRMGEEEAAIAEYQLAAAKLAAGDHGDYPAGELLLHRAGRPDLAMPYYQAGWQRRSQEHAVPCAIRLAQLYVEQGATDEVRAVVGEAEQFLLPPGNDTAAADFFHEITTLANQPALASLREELRDRALLGIAAKTRQQVHAGSSPVDTVERMFREPSEWSPALLSDARFAARSAARRRPAGSAASVILTTTVIRARIPVVTAVTWAAATGDLFLGYESGEVFCYRPATGAVIPLQASTRRVKSLAADAVGEHLVVLEADAAGSGSLVSYSLAGSRIAQLERADIYVSSTAWLCQQMAGLNKQLVGCWNRRAVEFFDSQTLTREASLASLPRNPDFHVGLMLLPANGLTFLGFEGDSVAHCTGYPHLEMHQVKMLGWCPNPPPDSDFANTLLAWRRSGSEDLKLAGVGVGGVLNHSVLTFHKGNLIQIVTHSATAADRYRAVAFVHAGTLAAVTPSAVHWLQAGPTGLRMKLVTNASLPAAIACFAHPAHHELIVVCAEGSVVRMPFPF